MKIMQKCEETARKKCRIMLNLHLFGAKMWFCLSSGGLWWRLATLLWLGSIGRLWGLRFLLLLLGGELLFVGFEIFAQALFAFPFFFCLASLKGFTLIFKKIIGHKFAV